MVDIFQDKFLIQMWTDNSILYNIFQMNINSTIFFAWLLFITYSTVIDQLTSVQSNFVTAAPSGTNVLKLGDNSYQITYATAFSQPPRAFPTLCQFSSQMTTTYDVSVKTSGWMTTKFTLQIKTGSNWNYLSYSILSLPGVQITLVTIQYTGTDLGINSNKAAITKTKDVGELVIKSPQKVVRFDVFITGFKLTVSDASSNFFLNTSINYGPEDKTKSKYNDYNDYIYQIDGQGTYPSGIAVTQTSVSLSLNWFGDLQYLQMTFISHTVVLSPTANNQFTGGYSTLSVAKSKYNITLMDPSNNKNNLGSLNAASFYGFTCININPITTVDANISLLYSYSTNVTSSGSKINSLSTSYYFYQKLADSIVDYKFNQVIDVQFDKTILNTYFNPAPGINKYYRYIIQSANTKINFLTPNFFIKSDTNYLMTLEILTPLGCFTGTVPLVQLYMNFTDYDADALKASNKQPANNYFINPNQPCTSTAASQFLTPVQKMFRYFKTQITATYNQYITASFSLNSGDSLYIYLKNLNIYQLSKNVLIDPMITEPTISSFQTYYKSAQSSRINFTVSIPDKTFSNAVTILLWNYNPFVILELRDKVTLTTQVKYTLSLYLLDSAGNLQNYMTSPTFSASHQIDANAVNIINQAATVSKPFCSPAFNATTPLPAPVDQFYLKFDVPFVSSTTGDALISFTVSDSSFYDHMYAIRGISIKYIEYFDPIARKNVQQCPQNTYLTNTIPPACLPCYVQNKIDNGSKCLCPPNTFQNQNAVCIQCSYSCTNCSSINKCTSCPAGRTFDANLFMCNCTIGFDDGVNSACGKCAQTCLSCLGNTYNCTSCPIGSVLDAATSACICGAGYFNDTTTRCGKCSHKCGNCLENANKCTSCLNQSGSTFDPATSTCKCNNGFSFSPSGICVKNRPIYIQNYYARQSLKTCILEALLTPINNSTLKDNDILKYIIAILILNLNQRKLDSQNLTLNIVQIILLPNNLVQFIVQNPPFDIINATILLNINNPNINQTSIQFTLPQLYSTQTMKSISSSTPSSITSTVLLTILLFIMLIFYVLGYKHNHTISFIQKISFLRFNLPITASTFAFLYNLKYSYYAYGVNALQSLLSQNYLQNSNGNFYFVDQDANILRNVGIPILLSIAIILLRLIGLLLFKSSQQTTSSKKYYYRTIEYVQKTIMFPIIFFGIAEITFANMYKKSDRADSSIYNPSLAFSVIYIIYFAILAIATGFSKQISNYAKLELAGEYLFSIFDSIIIIQTYYTNNVLTLIITIVIKCIYELFLKYTYAAISKLDIMKIIITVFQIALIGILSNRSTSLASIQALFVIVVVIDLLYVLGTTILKAMDKQKIQENGKGEIHESNKGMAEKIPMDSTNVFNP